jgi:hypothetical protein
MCAGSRPQKNCAQLSGRYPLDLCAGYYRPAMAYLIAGSRSPPAASPVPLALPRFSLPWRPHGYPVPQKVRRDALGGAALIARQRPGFHLTHRPFLV